jgi:hypothetical protein
MTKRWVRETVILLAACVSSVCAMDVESCGLCACEWNQDEPFANRQHSMPARIALFHVRHMAITAAVFQSRAIRSVSHCLMTHIRSMMPNAWGLFFNCRMMRAGETKKSVARRGGIHLLERWRPPPCCQTQAPRFPACRNVGTGRARSRAPLCFHAHPPHDYQNSGEEETFTGQRPHKNSCFRE